MNEKRLSVDVDLLRKDIADGHLDAMGDTVNAPPVYYAKLVTQVFSNYWGSLTTHRSFEGNGYNMLLKLFLWQPGHWDDPKFWVNASLGSWSGSQGTFKLHDDPMGPALKKFTVSLHPDSQDNPWTHIGALLSYTRTLLDKELEREAKEAKEILKSLPKADACNRLAEIILGSTATREEILERALLLSHMPQEKLDELIASLDVLQEH